MVGSGWLHDGVITGPSILGTSGVPITPTNQQWRIRHTLRESVSQALAPWQPRSARRTREVICRQHISRLDVAALPCAISWPHSKNEKLKYKNVPSFRIIPIKISRSTPNTIPPCRTCVDVIISLYPFYYSIVHDVSHDFALSELLGGVGCFTTTKLH